MRGKLNGNVAYPCGSAGRDIGLKGYYTPTLPSSQTVVWERRITGVGGSRTVPWSGGVEQFFRLSGVGCSSLGQIGAVVEVVRLFVRQ